MTRPSSCLLFFLLFVFFDNLFVDGIFTSNITNLSPRGLNILRKTKQTKEFLEAHNTARLSSGVPPLEWNKALGKFAHKWAKKRKYDCNLMHSGGPYGENLFWYLRKDLWSPERVVKKWYDERFDYDHRTNKCESGEKCGHYTQIVWRTTTAVGCACVKCNDDRGFLVVCEYDPRGNYVGRGPFDQTQ